VNRHLRTVWVPVSTLEVTHDPLKGGLLESETNTLITSNPNLQPEDSRSFSGGFVYSPKYAPGLNLSLTFGDIERTGVVTARWLNKCWMAPLQALSSAMLADSSPVSHLQIKPRFARGSDLTFRPLYQLSRAVLWGQLYTSLWPNLSADELRKRIHPGGAGDELTGPSKSWCRNGKSNREPLANRGFDCKCDTGDESASIALDNAGAVPSSTC